MSDALPRRRHRFPPGNVDAHVVLIASGLVMAFPFVWQILVSLSVQSDVTAIPPHPPDSLHFENYVSVFAQFPFVSQLTVSVVVTLVRVAGQVIIGSMAGYAFARLSFPAKRLVFAFVLAILMVPPQAFLISQYQIIESMGWLNSIQGIVAPGLFSAFAVFLMRQFFRGLPEELEEAARLDGANPFQIFWRVMLPLARPGISAMTILGVLASWNDLLWPLVVATRPGVQPLSVGLATLQGQYTTIYPILMSAALLAAAPILISFLVMQRQVIDGLAFSGMK